MKRKKIFKQFSLQDKKKYWAKQLDVEVQKRIENGNNKPSTRQLYATGFLTSVKNGRLSQGYDKQEDANKLGQLAGLKARIKNK